MADSICLDLGAGNKRRPGYITVDVSGNPDVHSDLRTLPFPDGYADVVEAIHVIEHFYLWEVQPLLLEWRRVLKPGGLLVLECPNLELACLNFFKYPDQPALSMWAFFGDPGHRDPLMCHKWGYTPGTLSLELIRAGFRNVKALPAKFHRKELRDMRVECVK